MLSHVLITTALLFSGVDGQFRSKRFRRNDVPNALPPLSMRRGLSGNSTNTTQNTTTAPTTEAPTTAAPTTEAPVVTDAPTTVAVTDAPTTVVEQATDAPTTVAPTTVAPTTEAPVVANVTGNETAIPEAKVESVISLTMSLDISAFDTAKKAALGNALAYGLHSSSCESVSSMWDTKVDCFLGNANVVGVKFGFVPEIDTQLGATQPACDDAADCYGDDESAASRLLQAVELTNKGTFEVKAKGAAVLAQVQTAKAAMDSASAAGTFSAASIATEVAAAMARPAMNSTLGDVAAAVNTAVTAATVGISVTKVQGSTPAPAASTSGAAFGLGVTGFFAVVAGALLF